MKKVLLGVVIWCLVLVLLFQGVRRTDKKGTGEVLHVYNWGEYIDPEVLRGFEKETGIRVVYDTYASNEDLYVKLTMSDEHYDVIVPSDYMLERLIREGLLQPIHKENIPNFKEVDPHFLNLACDPENTYSVPYFWGTLGIVYNKTMFDHPMTSWSDLWDPENRLKFIMYDSQRDSIAIALKKLGYSMNSRSAKELREAEEALVEQKPLVYAYLGDEGRDVLVQGDAGMGVMYNGDAKVMIDSNPDLAYVVPKEGTNLFYDAFAIPKNAENPKAAEAFINYMCDPKVAAKNTEDYVGYSTPIRRAKDYLSPEVRDDEVVYPDLDTLPPLEVYRDLGDMVEVYDEIWTHVRAVQ